MAPKNSTAESGDDMRKDDDRSDAEGQLSCLLVPLVSASVYNTAVVI